MGARPDIKLSVKLKDGGQRHYPMAAWKNERGISGKLEEGWKLIGPDGAEYTSGKEGNSWFDVYDNREDSGAKPASDADRPRDTGGGFGDDNIPFSKLDERLV